MKVAIVCDSRTGTTRDAATAMGRVFEDQGYECSVHSVADADPKQTFEADLICIGSWTQGLFLFLQHPTKASMQFIDRLGDLHGKKAVVFCTYKLATGSLLPKMAAALEAQGAQVVAQFKSRGAKPADTFRIFVATMTAAE